MTNSDPEKSLNDEVTFAGAAKRRSASADVSLGDEQTLGDGLSGQETVIDDGEVVDLEARYKIEGALGQGGMGTVLLATDTRLGRKVAIKRILGEAAGNRKAVARFLTEAKAIAALNHPNVVQIHDSGRAKDGPFLIMEYVDGGSLADRCREGAIPLDDAVELACQICDGLAKAHDAGIVHRDIKPANVLLNRDGVPKLTDFGLAKAEATDHGMTMTGAVLGTPDFMPPEQRRDAGEVDARSDLWSLAATVYQMVTGRSPKIIRFNDIPAALQDVLAKALEDRKDARYQTARELRDALKTSLRAAAVAVPDVVEGKCPACGVQNDASRRFCRGCGESLEGPCLSCTKPMPMWEEICGQCGAKQTLLVEERRLAMAARQAEAEGLLGDFAFDQALEIATQLRDEAHPRLKHLSGWATAFLEQVEKSREQQVGLAAEALAEALKHEQAYDYASAVSALSTVPLALRDVACVGTTDTVDSALDRMREKKEAAQRLDSLIRQQCVEKSLAGLEENVSALLELQPQRQDLQKLKTQLAVRQRTLIEQRETAVADARRHLQARSYANALKSLTSIDSSVTTPAIVSMRLECESTLQRIHGLHTQITDAVAAKRFDGLLGVVYEYLKLVPNDAGATQLKQQLLERRDTIVASMSSLVERAKSLLALYEYGEAEDLLLGVPKEFRSHRVVNLIQLCTDLKVARHKALARLRNMETEITTYDVNPRRALPNPSSVDELTRYKQLLSSAGVSDSVFESDLAEYSRKRDYCLKRSSRLRAADKPPQATADSRASQMSLGETLWNDYESRRCATVKPANSSEISPGNAQPLILGFIWLFFIVGGGIVWGYYPRALGDSYVLTGAAWGLGMFIVVPMVLAAFATIPSQGSGNTRK